MFENQKELSYGLWVDHEPEEGQREIKAKARSLPSSVAPWANLRLGSIGYSERLPFTTLAVSPVVV